MPEQTPNESLSELEQLLSSEQSAAVLEAILGNAPSLMMINRAPDGKILRSSEYAAQRLGRPRRDLEGLSLGEFAERLPSYDLSGQPIPASERPTPRALRGEAVRELEFLVEAVNGERIPVLVNASPIRNARGEIIGSISSSTDLRPFKALERSLREAVAQREALYRELTHRVKNHLQILTALVGLESRSPARSAEDIGDQIQGKLRALAAVYRSMDRAEVGARVEARRFLEEVCLPYASAAVNVEAEVAPLDLTLASEQAGPVGMLVNEAIANSRKHAFPEQHGRIQVSLRRQERGRLRLEVADDGVGWGPVDPSRASHGLELMRLFAKQLHGELELGGSRLGGALVAADIPEAAEQPPDSATPMPDRSDMDESGPVASAAEAFERASADNAHLMSELEAALETAQDYQSWLKLALEAGRMVAWRRKLPDGPIEPCPEMARMMGSPPDTNLTMEDFDKVIVDPDVVRRLEEDRARAVAGEFDNQALGEMVVAYRPIGTTEIRWAMLRREVVADPARHGREVVGVAIDVTERKHMMDELNHRVKNNLATVLSLAMQTTKSTEDLQGFTKAFTGRVQALSRINELLIRHGWRQVELRDVIATALRPYLGAGVEFKPASPEHTTVSARAAVSLCQVLHELAVNATQYGALADDGGRLEIAWSEPDPEHGALTWIERAPSPKSPPSRFGFGATLIQRLAAGDLGGRADLDFRPEGLAATINFELQGATA